jgi:hypothetical protein
LAKLGIERIPYLTPDNNFFHIWHLFRISFHYCSICYTVPSKNCLVDQTPCIERKSSKAIEKTDVWAIAGWLSRERCCVGKAVVHRKLLFLNFGVWQLG